MNDIIPSQNLLDKSISEQWDRTRKGKLGPFQKPKIDGHMNISSLKASFAIPEVKNENKNASSKNKVIDLTDTKESYNQNDVKVKRIDFTL